MSIGSILTCDFHGWNSDVKTCLTLLLSPSLYLSIGEIEIISQ